METCGLIFLQQNRFDYAREESLVCVFKVLENNRYKYCLLI